MPGWLSPILCVEAAVWAALFAQLGHINRADRAVGQPCARIAAWLLVAGTGFFLLHWASAAQLPNVEAARITRTAPAVSHAPISLQALARDLDHRSVDLLARDDQ